MSALSAKSTAAMTRNDMPNDVDLSITSGVAVYQGGFAFWDASGRVTSGINTGSNVFCGVIQDVTNSSGNFDGSVSTATGNAGGTIKAKVRIGSPFCVTGTSLSATADNGKLVYAPTDNPLDLTLTSTNNVKVGRIIVTNSSSGLLVNPVAVAV